MNLPAATSSTRLRLRYVLLRLLAVLWCALPVPISAQTTPPDAPAALTELATLHRMDVGQANRKLPVRARGVCTYPNSRGVHFYLHDGTAGTVVNLKDPALCPRFGEEVEVTGVTSGYQNVIGIDASTVEKLGVGKLPKARPITASQADHSVYSQWVEVEGVVLEAFSNTDGAIRLNLVADGTWFSVVLRNAQPSMTAWDGARLRCRGLNAGLGTLNLFCSSPDLITVIATGQTNPFDAPTRTLADVRALPSPTADRIKLRGTVLDAGSSGFALRDGEDAAWVEWHKPFPIEPGRLNNLTTPVPVVPVQPGDFVEVVASPMGLSPSLALLHAQVRTLRNADRPPEPRRVTAAEIFAGRVTNDLVTVRGRLIGYFAGDYGTGPIEERWREVLRLVDEGVELEVIAEGRHARGVFSALQVNDEIEASGLVRAETGTPAFRLRVRTPQDVRSFGVAAEVLTERYLRIAALAGLAVAAAVLWGAWLRARLKRERQLAVERNRADEAVRALNTKLEERVAQRTAELEQAHQELRRALETEREMSELKSRFVALVSHEFRTPLGITMSAVELLRGYMNRLPEDQRRELLDDIFTATVRMAAMMEQALLLGRVEAGTVDFTAEPLELGPVCQVIVDEVLSATGQKCPIHVTMTANFEDATGDEALLRHILSNLLSNAVKYSPPGSPVDFTVQRAGEQAEFIVRDHGIGIPQEDHARLFEAFYRAGNVGQTQGTGLGLLIVKRCVELHRGTIDFTSRPGEGTAFTVRLPLFASVTDAPAPLPPFPSQPHPQPA